MSKRLALTAAMAVCALLAAGCGSSSDASDATPTTEWADGLCSSITTWQSAITSIIDTLKAGGLTKDSLTAAVDDAEEATKNFTDEPRRTSAGPTPRRGSRPRTRSTS